MRVMGFDPSLSNFGMSKGNIVDGIWIPDTVGLITTAKGKNLKQVRKSSDDLRRCGELIGGLSDFVKDVDVVFVEVPHGSQSASAAYSKGVSHMAIATIQVPVIQCTAEEVKVAATGQKTASKKDMIDWAFGLYPDLDWLRARGKSDGDLTNANEHIADSMGAVHAGMNTPEFALAMRFSMEKAA